MALVDQAREFLSVLNYEVAEKDKNFLVAERPGLGGGVEQTCVWILTRDARHARSQVFLEDEYLNRFRGASARYRGGRLYFLVDTLEGFSQNFLTQTHREVGVKVQVPAYFFDMPFKHEVARHAASAIADLVNEAKNFEARRVAQAYEWDGQVGIDLVPDLLADLESSQDTQEASVWLIVAPAGQGKSILFSCLFDQLYQRFQENKRRRQLYPRPMPMLPAHIREAAGKNVAGLIDAFLRTDVGMPTTRGLFDWMIDNRHAIWMLDGLDEVIVRDDTFLSYLEDRITTPGSKPAILICVRDSLLNTSDELTDFVDYYQSVVKTFRLKPWDKQAVRTHAWLKLEGKKPREDTKDTARVRGYLKAIEASSALETLVTLPFYADLMSEAYAEQGKISFQDDVELLGLATRQLCQREYGKGVMDESVLPLPVLIEWLEELAAVSYDEAGVSVDELRELASVLLALVTLEIDEEEQQSLIQQITMAPFLRQSSISGRVEFTHEILADYLAGQKFWREFEGHSPLFVSHLSKRTWPSDSILFRVIAKKVVKTADILEPVLSAGSVSPEGLRNLAQLAAMCPEGDRVFRDGRMVLDGLRLEGVRFAGLNLEGVSLRCCNLTNTDFDRCNLRTTQFEGAVLKDTRFTNLPGGSLQGATFGNVDHFESVVVRDGKRLTDEKEFQRWLLKETGGAKSTPTAVSGGCPTISQLLHMFRKFVRVDGQARRDWLEKRALIRGKQYTNAPHYEKCVKTTIEFGYLEAIHHSRIRRPQGSKYGEIVTFVKGGDISEGLRSLLESLCQVPRCRHVRM